MLPRTELIVAFDYPRWVSLNSLVRRTVRRAVSGVEACNGNIETWRKLLSPDSILVWHFRSFVRKRAQIAAWEADPVAPPVVRLRSLRETERWLETLRDRCHGRRSMAVSPRLADRSYCRLARGCHALTVVRGRDGSR